MYTVVGSVKLGKKMATAHLSFMDGADVYKAVGMFPDADQNMSVKEMTSSDLVQVIEWIAKESGSSKLAVITARKFFASMTGYMREFRSQMLLAKPAVKQLFERAKKKAAANKAKANDGVEHTKKKLKKPSRFGTKKVARHSN